MDLKKIFEALKKTKVAEAKELKKEEIAAKEVTKPEAKKTVPKPLPKEKPEVKKEVPVERRKVERDHKEPEMSKGEILGKHFDALAERKHAKAKQIVAKAAEEHGEKFAMSMEQHNKDYMANEKK